MNSVPQNECYSKKNDVGLNSVRHYHNDKSVGFVRIIGRRSRQTCDSAGAKKLMMLFKEFISLSVDGRLSMCARMSVGTGEPMFVRE